VPVAAGVDLFRALLFTFNMNT